VSSTHAPLRRLIGTTTALCVGLGVAVGSGIFRTPGDIARQLNSPAWIIAAWLGGGLFTLAAGLVSAELGTRFPRAGGEYAFLKEAYGEFVGFFYGWAYTFFGVGVGVAVMAVAFGEVCCDLLHVDARFSPLAAIAGLVVVTMINCIGLRTGAGVQNVLTLAKVLALAALAVAGLLHSGPAPVTTMNNASSPALVAFAAALASALWSYDGATDSVKMAEEVKDVHRALPRALITASLMVTALYVLVNLAYLHVLTPAEMAGSKFVGSDVMERLAGPAGRTALSAITALILFGALVSTQLSSVRVTFALARDGLAFGILSRMSPAQSPVAALLTVGAVSMVFAALRNFQQVLSIYLFATAILFSLNYASLLVFRRRDHVPPDNVFHCPAAPLLVAALIAVQTAIAFHIAVANRRDTLYTCLLLVIIAAFYVVWRRARPRSASVDIKPPLP